MELQISYCVCAEVQKASYLWEAESRNRENSTKFMWKKGVEVLEAEACADHIHMLVSIPPRMSVADFMGYLKGKSALLIFDRFANLKYRYGNRHFWCRGYYVDTVGRNKKAIAEYIRNQLQEDIANDQVSMKEYYDPFTGEKYFGGKK